MKHSKEQPSFPKNGTIIGPCNCKHAYQDRQYGQGKRLKNTTTKVKGARCTVCSKVSE